MHIQIKTKIPHSKDIQFIKELDKYEASSMHTGQLPIVWDWASDFRVGDRWGNEFIDLSSGIAITNSGHSNKDIISSIIKQCNKFLIYSYTFPTEIRYQFTKELVNLCYPKGKAFLMSAGTEATECAVKIMRLYTKKKYIISFEGAMHGKTALAESLKGIHKDDNMNIINLRYPYPDEEIFYDDQIPFNCVNNIAGIIIESYRGWDAKFFSKLYIQNLCKYAKKHNILVCFDEIQSGFGRTGKLFAFEHYEVKPDLICCGKGISSSLPLSAVIGRKELLDIPTDLSSTHSANPLSCAASLANIRQIPELVKESERKGKILHNLLKRSKLEINGKGLVAAILTNTTEEADKIVIECLKRGVILIRTGKPSIKIAPPLSIPITALKEAVQVILEVIKEKKIKK